MALSNTPADANGVVGLSQFAQQSSIAVNGTPSLPGDENAMVASIQSIQALLGLLYGIGGAGTAVYGSGQDGAVNFDGTNTFAAFTTKLGSVYTLTRDVFLSSMRVQSGVEVKAAGFKIFVSGTCRVLTGGLVTCDGKDAVGPTPGGTSSLGTLGVGTAGGAGHAGVAAGSNGTIQANTLSDASPSGGPGGAGGAQGGGLGGTYIPNASNGGANFLTPILTGMLFSVTNGGANAQSTPIGGGAGGGGGGSDNAGVTAGGGGGGGGVIVLNAYELINDGTIRARGGAGAAATGVGGNGGGGGGGGGGIVLQLSRKRSGAGTIDVSGGGGGAAVGGTGVAGTPGSLGHVNSQLVM